MATEDEKLASPQICKIGDAKDYVTCELRPIRVGDFEKLLAHYKSELLQVAYTAADGMPEKIAAKIREDARDDCSTAFVSDQKFVRWCLLIENARILAIQICAKPVNNCDSLFEEQIRKWFAVDDTLPDGVMRDDILKKFYRDSGFRIPEETTDDEAKKNDAEAEATTSDQAENQEKAEEQGSVSTTKS